MRCDRHQRPWFIRPVPATARSSARGRTRTANKAPTGTRIKRIMSRAQSNSNNLHEGYRETYLLGQLHRDSRHSQRFKVDLFGCFRWRLAAPASGVPWRLLAGPRVLSRIRGVTARPPRIDLPQSAIVLIAAQSAEPCRSIFPEIPGRVSGRRHIVEAGNMISPGPSAFPKSLSDPIAAIL